MIVVEANTFISDRAWGAMDLAAINHATIRLHWTDQPYVWHTNDKPEIFVVLDGAVDMHYKHDGEVSIERLVPGSICVVSPGDEHVAHPVPEARILVIEEAGAL